MQSMDGMSGRPPTSGQHVANSSVPIGLRVYASCSQGGRKYMEDNYDLKYQFNADNELQYIYLAIFDGHGGDVAAKYAKQHLCHNIIRQRAFWSKTNDNDVLQAIRKGFVRTHYDMRKEVPNWPKTASGLPSTSGTTASIVFIMNGKYYTGHVGDSRIVLGRKHEASGKWMSCSLTRDHKPESPRERRRIEAAGGQVMNKSGVDRVVWNRPKLGHKGPIRRSTSFDQIPFLAVARSLGDLWSFNSANNTYIVSPEPDVKCIPIDGNDMCLVLASDGLWNMMTTQTAVRVIQEVEEDQYSSELLEAVFGTGSTRLFPSRALVHFCLNRWYQSRFRADNTTVLAVMIEDNQGIQLNRSDQSVPMSSLFSDSEEDDSDDGYYETFDSNDYVFSQTYDCLKNNSNNNSNTNIEDNDNKSTVITTEISSTTTIFKSSETTTVPENQKPLTTSTSCTSTSSSCSSAEFESDNSTTTPFTHKIIDENNQTIAETDKVLTPLTNVSPNFTDNCQPIEQTFVPIDDNSSQSSESSRDSGTVSPPTPLAITVGEELTEEEYASLPSLVNLSTNEWDLFVLFDPKSLSVLSTDFNGVPIGEENSCVAEECQSSLANINKVIEDNSPLNNYMYGRSSYLRQTPNASDFLINPADNFWPESSPFYSLTALRPRSSLPLNFMDDHFANKESDQCSPLISLKERTSAALNDNNLCIFGALSSSSVIQSSASSDSCVVKKLSKVLSNSSGIQNIRTKTSVNTETKRNRYVFRQLRRISIDNSSKVPKMSVHSLSKKRYSPEYSPPSKHLRSSLWTRPLVSKEHIMRMSFTRSLKQLAVGRLTRSRLRPIKLLKSFNKK